MAGLLALFDGTILPNVRVVACWMSSVGGGEVGQGGGVKDFLVRIDGGGGMLRGGGRDIVGGWDQLTCGIDMVELVSSFATASASGACSLMLVVDIVLAQA